MMNNNRGFGNWFIYLLLLGFLIPFAISLFTMFMGLMEQFGFTPVWKLGIVTLAGGLWVYLLYQRYHWLSWLLVACVTVFGVCSVALVRGYALEAPEGYVYDEADAGGLFSFYDTYYDNYASSDYDNLIQVDESDTYVVVYTYAEDNFVTIDFPEEFALEGQWSFVSGKVELSGAVNGTIYARGEYNHISPFQPNESSQLKVAQPYLAVTLPLDDSHIGERVDMKATMDIEIWEIPGRVSVETREREIRAEVTDIEDGGFYDDYENMDWVTMCFTASYKNKEQRYASARRSVETFPGWPVLMGGGILSVVLAFWLIRRQEVLRPGMMGSGIILIQRSGQEMFGIETHYLADANLSRSEMPDDGRGVLIGRVNAQSPAGRGGLQSGDILRTIDGKVATSPGQVNRMTRQFKRGAVIAVVVWRYGEEMTYQVRI